MILTHKQLLAKIAKEKKSGTFKGIEHTKFLPISAIKGVEVTSEILAIINKFSIESLTAEQIYIRKFLLAHNCVDRDQERFPELMIDDFVRTLPAKSQLIGHTRTSPGKGLFFQASAEEMTPEQFKMLTNEDPRLSESGTMVKVLWAWMYMLNNKYNEETILNINAGIYRHVSIGFRASDLIAIKGKYDQNLYWEYVPPGEALEGSIVWLGAQPGATTQKAAGEDDDLEDYKSAVSFSPTNPADEGRAWDAGAAKARLAKWASSDGTGDKDKIDWPKYRKGFAWYDAENPENIGSYKLPHHDVIDGVIAVVWNGVSAAMAALLGARGGVDIPELDFDSVYNHLSKHYKQFDKEPPAKSAQDENVKGGSKKMKELIAKLKMLYPDKTFSEENLHTEIKVLLDEKDTAIAGKDKRIAELEPLAADGKVYRDSLIAQYVAHKAKLGEVAETPEAQDRVKAVAALYPMDFLKSEVDALQKRVEEKFPDKSQTKGDDRKDKSEDGGEVDWKKKNPIVPDDETKKEDK